MAQTEKKGTCRICGKMAEGQPFERWVKDTFTNHDLLMPGDIICSSCLFWFEQRSTELQRIMGKDRPLRMQNYSHFVVDGQWTPVSKGNKPQMTKFLLAFPFPEIAVIAVSGQKHLAFRARHNPTGQNAGWVQLEEQAVWVESKNLESLLTMIEELYQVFSKGEIETGNYSLHRIMQYGSDRWYQQEQEIRLVRKTGLFQLALFLAQRKEDDGNSGDEGNSSDAAQDNLEGDPEGLQEQVPNDDLGAIRERDQISSLHGQPGEIHQLDLFKNAG
jgi:hypothetical protein